MNRGIVVSLFITVAGLFLMKTVCGNDLIVSGESVSNGLKVLVYAPAEFTNRVEIYACSNLVAGDWRVVAENLRPSGGNPAHWYTDVGESGFFMVEDMDIDGDGDGLSDAREKYVDKTNPNESDSDGDGMPDKWEVQHALNPLSDEDAMLIQDGLELNNLEIFQTTPELPAYDSDGDGFIDAYDQNPESFDYTVAGEGVFNMVASGWSASYASAPGFGSGGQRVLNLHWSDDFFFPPHPDHNNGGFCVAGSSRLKWVGIALPDDGFFLSRFKDYYWWHLNLFWSSWDPSLPSSFQGLELYEFDRYFGDPERGAADAVAADIAQYVSNHPSFYNYIHAPTNGSGFLHLLGGQDGDSQRCVIFTIDLAEESSIRFLENSGKMTAVGYGASGYGGYTPGSGLPGSQTSRFKFVFNQSVTNKPIKWITYNYDFGIACQVNFTVHQCAAVGAESELFCLNSSEMVVPTVDLNGDFDLDGDVDQNDTILRAPATASLRVILTEPVSEMPGSGVIPVTVNSTMIQSTAPESVLKVKISGVEPGERFRLWSTIHIIPAEEVPDGMLVIGAGGGQSELIVDPPLLIDTEERVEHEWPVVNISSLRQGPSYICNYNYEPEFPKTLYLECISCGTSNDGKAKIELVYEFGGEEMCATALPITVIRSKLVPDWNHDRAIDMADQNQEGNNPFRFWINDDNDNGDVSEGDSDVPGQGGGWIGFEKANYKDNVVNGRSDLPDFLPVWLDIKSVLEGYPVTNGAVYKLSQADGALKFVYTDLTSTGAGDYLVTEAYSCGSNRTQNIYEADTIQITSSGVALDTNFLSRIAVHTNKGVLMMEAVETSTAPLVLEVFANNTIVSRIELPLSLSGVEDMYRKVNLRSMTEQPQQNAPTNYPDTLSNGKNIVFLHGFNVDEKAARGWNSEMFKRLYWSGSKSKFHAVTWRGNEDGLVDPLYQENVNNAFLTAPYLAQYVNTLSGDTIVMAHSLGNMVVSSAIQDHEMSVQKYLMLDAAVASEAFDAALFNNSTNNNPMLHADWRGYEPRTWSANFHELCSGPDPRTQLTWRGRFAAVVSNAYNFYSSEDEVFEINPQSVNIMSGVDFDLNIWPFSSEIHGLSRYAWQKQEVLKGRDSSWLPGSLGSTKWWGWGFHHNLLGLKAYSAEEANGLSTNELRESPVFRHHPDWYDEDNLTLTTNEINQMLAVGLPAMSPSAGQSYINPIQQNGGGNFNMSTLKDSANGWPRNEQPYPQRWLHSDCKDMAYLYTYRLFEEVTAKGGLK
jgi:hypothetical protein